MFSFFGAVFHDIRISPQQKREKNRLPDLIHLDVVLFDVFFFPENDFLVIHSDLFGMVKWPFKGLSDL